jgi:hypothetical protein
MFVRALRLSAVVLSRNVKPQPAPLTNLCRALTEVLLMPILRLAGTGVQADISQKFFINLEKKPYPWKGFSDKILLLQRSELRPKE